MSKESAMAVATGTQVPSTTPVAPQPTESAPGVVSPQQESTQTADPRLQAILKKEVKLTQEQLAFKKQQAEWAEKIKKADEIIGKANQYDETFKKSKVDALKLIGFSDTDILNIMADVATPTEKTPEEIASQVVQQEIKKLEDKRAEEAKTNEAKRNMELINNLKNDISKTIEKDKAKLKFCKFYGKEAEELAYSFIEAVVKSEQKLLPIDEALNQAEEYFREQKREMDALDKEEAKEAQAPTSSTTTKPTVSPEKPKPKTLTNQVTPTVQALINRRESQDQKRDRLMRALSLGVHPETLR